MFLRKKERRFRNFLIYPRFQLGLLAVQAAFLTAAFVAVQFVNRLAFGKLIQMGREAGLNAQHSYFGFIDGQASAFFWHTLLAFVGVLILSSVCTLTISFRMAGPLFRLRKYLRQLAEQGPAGLEPLRFRGGDFYSDIPPALNEALTRLREESKRIQ